MNIEHSLISTALLAIQHSGELKYHSKWGKSIPSGFYKSVLYLDSDKLSKFQVTVYLPSKSPIGYAIRVEAITQVPELLLTDHHLERFEEFEDLIDKDYSITAYKATCRHQLGK